MRILHTSDWHLGRLFHEVHLTDDQAYVLDRLFEVIKDTKPDVLLIAGDIYDRAVPPPEAVKLLSDVLSRLILDIKIPVILVAGNHDSPDRLSFGSAIMNAEGLYIFGPFSPEISPVVLEDDHGPVYFYPLPYTEPSVVRFHLEDDSIRDHDTAYSRILNDLKANHQKNTRSVLITHAFAQGCDECESERPLSVGGTGAVDSANFKWFDYTALGHLHRSQKAGGDTIQYSGTPMKYSFSEADHRKSVILVEMDGKGTCTLERISLAARRDVRQIEGYLEDILTKTPKGSAKEDYLSVKLLDEGALFDPIGKLRDVYPNVLRLERPFLTTGAGVEGTLSDHRKRNEAELFSDFYKQVTEEELTEEQSKAFTNIADDLRKQEREVS